MIRKTHLIHLTSCLFFAAMFVLVALPGCNKGTEVAKSKGKDQDKGKSKDDHVDIGPHGGPCAEWGNEDFHAEFIVDAGKKQVTVYILDGTAKVAPKIDAAKITEMKLTIIAKPPVPLDLKHDPKESGDKGIAFSATNDAFAKPDGMKVNISGKVDDKPYSGDVEYKAPKKTANLYLTPGGIYTVADIKANGNMTPAEKFKGKKFAHRKDLNPGDKVCPVTDKKANAECAWIVNGQRYEFCCQPCLDDFIDWAHHDPKQIKDAGEYVRKQI